MARWRSIPRKLRRLARIGGSRRALLVEAALWLALARLALIVVPFPWLARRLGTFAPPSAAPAGGNPPDEHVALAREIGWAVTRAARYVPFKAVCLPQAMAARVMLKRRGISSVLHFGAAKGKEKPFDAHAWLDAAGVEVTGFPVAVQFTEIACFV